LWIELRCADRYLTCGCGIRANRSTDRVTTWWFVTDRRPGVDLALVEARTPLGADALRATLGPNAVFAHDQRAAYRAEVRSRLYGGADLDQHLRLLHVVRNPRVGDRIDLDLPTYLTDALPQLSDAALDDAAQPLEDLEEHRRNVEDLTRTAGALDALDAVYRAYARAELHQRAGGLAGLVNDHRARQRAETRAREALIAAEGARDRAQQEIDRLGADERRLRTEIDALTSRDAYQAGAELTDLRAHVVDLDRQVAAAVDEVAERAKRAAGAREALAGARDDAESDLATLRDALSDLGRLAVLAGLAVQAPDAPAVPTRRPATGDATGDVGLPAGAVDADPLRARLADVRAAARARRDDVRDVRAALDGVDRAATALDVAERHVADAEAAERAALATFTAARTDADRAVEGWRDALGAWTGRLDAHRRAEGLTPVDPGVLAVPDLAGERDAVTDALTDVAQATVDHHQRIAAALDARRATEQSVVDELDARVTELRSRTLPDPPTGAWQRPERGACLADLIDFRPEVDERARARLEAAMEAAGLLGAELAPDGSLTLADGQLVAGPSPPAPAPLATLLTVTVPDDLAPTVDPAAVARVLDGISTRPDDMAAGGERTVVTSDGRFRTGVLRGRHTKDRAEHIGVTARRAALARQRAEAEAALAEARHTLAGTDAERVRRGELAAEAVAIRRALPSPAPVADALVRADHAELALDGARATLDRRRDDRRSADAAHADAVDASRRVASTLSLPPDRPGLDRVADTIREVTAGCDRIASAVAALVRAVAAWARQGDAWQQAVADEARSERNHADLERRREPVAMKLATLEDAVGIEYDEIVAAIAVSQADLEATGDRLEAARTRHVDAVAAVATCAGDLRRADDARGEAEQRCVAALGQLRRVLAVPGLVASAVGADPVAGVGADAGVGPVVGDGDHRGSADDPAKPGDRARRPHAGDAPADGAADDPAGPGDRARRPEAGDAPADGAADGPAGPGDGARRPHAGDAPADGAADVPAFPAVDESPGGARTVADAIVARIPPPDRGPTSADGVRQSLRQRRDALGAGWDAEDRQPDGALPLTVEVTGPLGRMPLREASTRVHGQLRSMAGLLSAKQDQALRNLLQGLIAREVAEKLHAARELVDLMNRRLDSVTTSHGIGVTLRWARRDDLDAGLADTIALLAKPPDLRTVDEDRALTAALSARIAEARRDDPEAPYRELIARVLDYRAWYRMGVILRRPGRSDERLTRRTALSEGEKKMVSYLPLFAAVAASCDALAESERAAPRFVLLDDAFAKVSEDNHAKLFGLLVQLDLDFIATSERLWGTHATVPELAITEVLRDADLGVIVLEHSHWDGTARAEVA
ncbi:MAG TPA: SbcC/MukB-like Walker B domain-containing protein, partial [Acidimicrobiales bacterium]